MPDVAAGDALAEQRSPTVEEDQVDLLLRGKPHEILAGVADVNATTRTATCCCEVLGRALVQRRRGARRLGAVEDRAA